MKHLKTIAKGSNKTMPNQLTLGSNYSIDLSFFSNEEKSELYKEYVKGVMDLSLTAQSYDLETQVLKRTLNQLSDNIDEVSIKGGAITLSHAQETKLGKTDVLMGNTRKARAGKLPSTVKNEEDFMPFYVIGGLIVLVIIGAVVS